MPALLCRPLTAGSMVTFLSEEGLVDEEEEEEEVMGGRTTIGARLY